MQENVSQEIEALCKEYMDLSISALNGDLVSLGKLGVNLVKSPLMIRNY